MKIAMLTILSLMATIAGCKDDTFNTSGAPAPAGISAAASPSAEAHKLVLRYNQLLSAGYKTTNMTNLQEVATPELAEKAYYHMAAIGEGKSRMVSELKKLDYVETDCTKPLTCRVVTKERWDFAYADILTGNRTNEVKDYIYDVQYVLESRQSRWIITAINATGEDRTEVPSWKEMFRKR